ncbi:MAG: nuclear transport factor 2 family protein [Chloroflexi bacterium]|nr:nuclear transport factor 2 family protein [Chloroflexota bacterium]
MINHATVAEWLKAYVDAWTTYDPEAIGRLFSDDAIYSIHPFDEEPVRGREAIVADWLEYPDAPGTYAAHYEPIAVDGNIAVTNGRTRYFEADGKTLERIFDNIFVLRFNDEGQCVEFREWYMKPRTQ